MGGKARLGARRLEQARRTLGDVIDPLGEVVPILESEWASLVRSISAKDQGALHTLFQRAHRPVFTLIVRIVGNRQTAEELTLDVFHHVWCHAAGYDAAAGPVLGWMMNLARSRAIDRVRYERRLKRAVGAEDWQDQPDAPDSVAAISRTQDTHALRNALSALPPEEQRALETAYYSELSYAETAERLGEPVGTIKTRIRSALAKLRHLLASEPES